MVPITPLPNSNSASPALSNMEHLWLAYVNMSGQYVIARFDAEKGKRKIKALLGRTSVQGSPEGYQELALSMLSEEAARIRNESTNRLREAFNILDDSNEFAHVDVQEAHRLKEIMAAEQEATTRFSEFVDRIVMG